MSEAEESLVSLLTDFSFSKFVTTRIVKFLYVLSIVLAGLSALGILVGGMSRGGGGAVVSLFLAPVAFVVMVLASRVWLEIVVVVFRIAENTAAVARALGKGEEGGGPDDAEGTDEDGEGESDEG